MLTQRHPLGFSSSSHKPSESIRTPWRSLSWNLVPIRTCAHRLVRRVDACSPQKVSRPCNAALESDDLRGSSITKAPTPGESSAFEPAVKPVNTPPTEVDRMYPPPFISYFESASNPDHSGNTLANDLCFRYPMIPLWNLFESWAPYEAMMCWVCSSLPSSHATNTWESIDFPDRGGQEMISRLHSPFATASKLLAMISWN